MEIEDAMNIFEYFESSEYMMFDRVINKLSNRPDLHAFMLLDSLVPGKREIVSSAEHDEIWLDVELSDLADVITKDHIIELIRCGVQLDGKYLCIFV